MIKEKEKAPLFELKDQNGKLIHLQDFAGKLFILYFYPRDNTPGCTTEACNFRDDYSIYQDLGVTIIGVSPDDEKSHANFTSKYSLPFTLLADVDHKVCEAFGVWAKKKNYGKEFFGVIRTTFLVGKDGKVAKVFEDVKPANHSTEVIAAVKELL